MNITIVEYNPIYHSAVVNIITTIQQQEFNLPITYEDQPDLQNITDFFNIFLVALYDNKPVGTIGSKTIQDFAIIRKMFVAQEFRGKTFGVAQKLLESLEEKITLTGIRKFYLGTTDLFKAAHTFYERNNYINFPKESLPTSFPVMKIDTKFYCKIT